MCPQDNHSQHIKSTEINQEDTFQRCPDDPKNPYIQIHNGLILDKHLSSESFWYLCYLQFIDNKPELTKKELLDPLVERYGKYKSASIIIEIASKGLIDSQLCYFLTKSMEDLCQ